ncbi:HlyD family type I secretion periplasmic adaptor subunit [Methylomagnum ishizawai]|uniref:HlyD family type I secretion periplasmic adaptor subunit n=1 Tax=Methylomagnum ishizawai TaxID=1760988 RepID=UPI001C327C99|nr:HlyD family type I secretion periplasmic adaptor subunit [Methylomagnum ishizawai]BBL75945.1 HlyD family type I secretion periplasmic adaptor subunit [Methylomagnum ishizawai]
MLTVTFDETGEASRIVRAGMFIIVFFVGGFAAWAFMAPIQGAVVAEGIIKIETKRKTIQHLEGGVIREILVHEGQYVNQGDPLVVLEDAEVKANLTILKDQLNALLAKEARLQAEQRFADKVEFPSGLLASQDPKVREMLINEKTLFLSKKKSVDEQIAITRQEMVEVSREAEGYQLEIKETERSIRLKEERVAMGEALSSKQFVDRSTYMGWQEALADMRANLGQTIGKLGTSLQAHKELELRIINLRNEYIKLADDELKETKGNIFELQQKIQPAELAVQRFRVIAPSDGQVIDLKVSTIGGVIRPGDALMDLVPKQQELLMEVKVMTKDIELVHVNQHADIQLLAYNSRTVPHIAGTVIYVSGDALEDKSNPSAPYYFLAHIRADADMLKDLPEVSLAPGMPLNAFIQTKSKTFFDIIFKTFEESVSRGLRQEA